MLNAKAPSRTPSGVSLMKTYMPPSSTNIKASDVEVTYSKNTNTQFTCISANLGSENCNTTIGAVDGMRQKAADGMTDLPNAADSKCVAVCPMDNNKVVRFKGDSLIWSSSLTNQSLSNTKVMVENPITYTSPTNVSSSCYYINATSKNCPTENSFGCQAYCMATPSASGFIVEQRCPNNQTSCDPMKLKWMKK